jgi:hypothetical protein
MSEEEPNMSAKARIAFENALKKIQIAKEDPDNTGLQLVFRHDVRDEVEAALSKLDLELDTSDMFSTSVYWSRGSSD